MDYEIMLETLNSKKGELEEQKNNIDNKIDGNLNALENMSGTDIESLYTKMVDSAEDLKNAYNKSYTWFDNYIKNLNSLEDSLASFNCSGVDTPKEFVDDFHDIFGKKLIPTLRSDEEKNANTDLGKLGESFSEIGQKIIDAAATVLRRVRPGGACAGDGGGGHLRAERVRPRGGAAAFGAGGHGQGPG